ncbi:hypothetical protein [Yoonia tamlensis]|nr:hypothetical protein [Yoonia tamlensis]
MLDIAMEAWDQNSAAFVEVLTTNQQGKPFGLKFGGAFAGPNVLVAGHRPLTSMVCDRLLQLPTIHWMRGTLTVISLDALEEAAMSRSVASVIEGRPDELLFLPYAPRTAFREAAAKESYWSILRLCTSLGMISGRGIPSNPNLAK